MAFYDACHRSIGRLRLGLVVGSSNWLVTDDTRPYPDNLSALPKPTHTTPQAATHSDRIPRHHTRPCLPRPSHGGMKSVARRSSLSLLSSSLSLPLLRVSSRSVSAAAAAAAGGSSVSKGRKEVRCVIVFDRV